MLFCKFLKAPHRKSGVIRDQALRGVAFAMKHPRWELYAEVVASTRAAINIRGREYSHGEVTGQEGPALVQTPTTGKFTESADFSLSSATNSHLFPTQLKKIETNYKKDAIYTLMFPDKIKITQ